MAKALKSQQEIEALMLSELQRVEGCEGATEVAIFRYEQDDVTWKFANVNLGTSSVDRCLSALAEIETRLQRLSDLAPDQRT